MEGTNVAAMVAKLRAAGMDVWADGDSVRTRWRGVGRAPFSVAVMLADLRDLGVVAVDYLKHEAAGVAAAKDQEVNEKPLDKPDGENQNPAESEIVLPQPDADGIVRLVGVPPEVAFAAGALIKAGRAELVGRVLIHQRTVTFDLVYREVGA